jgi:hypothetical protein
MNLYKRGVIMKDFWKNEWNLFLNDMQELGEFFLQPIEITGIPGSSKPKMLKPTVEETEMKASLEPTQGFWSREWNAFLMDMQNVGEFFLQPVEFSSAEKKEEQISADPLNELNNEIKNEASQIGFWQNEWNLFKEDLRSAKDFFTQPINFK